ARWAQRTQSCSASAISPLRAKDFDLLARLACAGQAAVSRTDLMSDVWDENWFGSTKTLDVHVACRWLGVWPNPRRPVHLLAPILRKLGVSDGT
ncbi:MAG: two component transcriptional regulator, winged helix family, partial [Jatrophihabitans sp.]|nr:two component transcriptional regulator, winged helix family [Jatrophihabitans sp.]